MRTDALNMRRAPATTDSAIAILVASCDRYGDLWPTFFALLRRFWPDCPFPVYLLSNTMRPEYSGVHNIAVGEDVSWSDNLLSALPRVPADHIFLFIDDLLICDKVNTASICDVLEDWIGRNGNYLRMNPSPKPDRIVNQKLGAVSAGTLYRTATVLSVWKKQLLLDLLQSSETAWEFETSGSVRSDTYDGFYSTRARMLNFVNAVIKGKWERSALSRLQALGVSPQLGNRQVMSARESLLFNYQKLRSHSLNLLPSRVRRPVRQLLSGKKA
jgi:hypothetical protein